MFSVFFVTAVGVVLGKALASDPFWNPIDIRSIPRAHAGDRIDVIYLKAPLLEAEIGSWLKYLDLFHGGLALRNTKTGYTFTMNYDSVDLSLFSSQFPALHTDAHGNTTFEWHNKGSLYAYNGIHPNFWTEQAIGSISGDIFNAFFANTIQNFNSTWPFYEMFNINVGDKTVVKSHECFDFVETSLAAMNKLGANLSGAFLRNTVFWFAAQTPKVVNIHDPAEKRAMVKFFTMLTESRSSVHGILDLFDLLYELELAGGSFYLHVGETYYSFPLDGIIPLKAHYNKVSFGKQ